MSVRNVFTREDLRSFESDLHSALVRDPDHQYAFDGVLNVWSSRFGCTLKAVNVHWDESASDVVLVGAFMSGNASAVVDESRGYPVIRHEVSVPFRECFEDMRSRPGMNEMYLVSKTRKAVMEKCIAYPMRSLSACGAAEGGRLVLGDYPVRDFRTREASRKIESVSFDGSRIGLEFEGGVGGAVSSLSLTDMQRLGERMLEVRGIIREAFECYRKEFYTVASENGTVSERDARVGAEKGVQAVYEKGYPAQVCRCVAKSFLPSVAGAFDLAKHSAAEIDAMMRSYRTGKGRLGEFHGRGKGSGLSVD